MYKNWDSMGQYEYDLSKWMSSPSISFKIGGMSIERDNSNIAIDKVYFSGGRTVVLWKDGEKTIVNCYKEKFDKEKGLAMAICKKLYGRMEFERILNAAEDTDEKKKEKERKRKLKK